MPATGLDHFNIRVPFEMLDAVRRFYIDLLELKEGFRPPFGSTGHWLYLGDQPVLHLSVFKDRTTRLLEGAGAIDHIAFACADFDAMCRKLESHGIAYKVADVPVINQRQIFFRDPAGNGVELNFSGIDLKAS